MQSAVCQIPTGEFLQSTEYRETCELLVYYKSFLEMSVKSCNRALVTPVLIFFLKIQLSVPASLNGKVFWLFYCCSYGWVANVCRKLTLLLFCFLNNISVACSVLCIGAICSCLQSVSLFQFPKISILI